MTGKSDKSLSLAAGGPARLRLSLRQLEVFVATARGGSTRAAADHIARSQSAASATLADLESTLGVQLFDRVGRRLLLNENGRALLPAAASMLDQASELEHLFTSDHYAPLRVAASMTIGEYLLPNLMARWKSLHPASPVRLVIGNTGEVINAVAAFDVDIGFIEGTQVHPELVVRPWLTDELVVVASPDHPLAGSVATMRQLRKAIWAVREPGSGTREAADRWLVKQLGNLDIGFELGSTESTKRLAATGAALACVSREAVLSELEQGTLVELRTRLPRSVRRLAIVLHRDKRLGRGAEVFLQHCADAQQGRSASTANVALPSKEQPAVPRRLVSAGKPRPRP